MRLPVDTSVVHFVSAGPAEPSLDFDTKQQKTDANGVAVPRQPVLYFNDQLVTLDGLHAALGRLPASRITPSLILKVDKDVPLDVVTGIMNVAPRRFSIDLVTQPESAAP